MSSVRLAWSRVDGALRVRDPADRRHRHGHTRRARRTGDRGGGGNVHRPDLPAATEFCFRLLVDTDVGRSAPSETKCATTAELARSCPFGPPRHACGGHQQRAAGVDAERAGCGHVVFVDDQAATEVTGDRVQLAVAPGEHCFAAPVWPPTAPRPSGPVGRASPSPILRRPPPLPHDHGRRPQRWRHHHGGAHDDDGAGRSDDDDRERRRPRRAPVDLAPGSPSSSTSNRPPTLRPSSPSSG